MPGSMAYRSTEPEPATLPGLELAWAAQPALTRSVTNAVPERPEQPAYGPLPDSGERAVAGVGRSVLDRDRRRAEHRRELRHVDLEDLAVVHHAARVQCLLVNEVLAGRR